LLVHLHLYVHSNCFRCYFLFDYYYYSYFLYLLLLSEILASYLYYWHLALFLLLFQLSYLTNCSLYLFLFCLSVLRRPMCLFPWRKWTYHLRSQQTSDSISWYYFLDLFIWNKNNFKLFLMDIELRSNKFSQIFNRLMTFHAKNVLLHNVFQCYMEPKSKASR